MRGQDPSESLQHTVQPTCRNRLRSLHPRGMPKGRTCRPPSQDVCQLQSTHLRHLGESASGTPHHAPLSLTHPTRPPAGGAVREAGTASQLQEGDRGRRPTCRALRQQRAPSLHWAGGCCCPTARNPHQPTCLQKRVGATLHGVGPVLKGGPFQLRPTALYRRKQTWVSPPLSDTSRYHQSSCDMYTCSKVAGHT